MPDWVIPAVLAVLGGGGVGTIITSLLQGRATELGTMITALQAERAADRQDNVAQSKRIDALYVHLGAFRDYSTAWEEWCRAGHPDPPGRPVRPLPPHN